MEILIMGCGTSQGCPLPAHDNPGLDLKNERNWRARTSIHVVIEGHHVQVDAAPEFRLQCLRERIEAALAKWIMDAFLPAPPIRLAALMEDAVLVGALALAAQRHNPRR